MGKKEKKDKQAKPLDRMTAKELRDYALSLGEIAGVHAMNKEELLAAIKEHQGIVDEGKKTAKAVNVRELKEKIKALRLVKSEAVAAGAARSRINVLRKRINRMKKRTRQTA